MILASLAPEAVDNLVVWGSNSYVAKEDQDMVNGLRDMSKWSDKMKLPLESKLYIVFLNSLVFLFAIALGYINLLYFRKYLC